MVKYKSNGIMDEILAIFAMDPTSDPTHDPTIETTPAAVVKDIDYLTGLMIAGAVLVCCLLFVMFLCCRKKKKKKQRDTEKDTADHVAAQVQTKDVKSDDFIVTTADESVSVAKEKAEEIELQTAPTEGADVKENAVNDKDNGNEEGNEIKQMMSLNFDGDAMKELNVIKSADSEVQEDSVGAMDGFVDTGNKDDVALDFIMDGAKKHIPTESIKFTV